MKNEGPNKWEAIGFIMILVGIFLFNFGHHNVDLSFNMLKVSYDHNLSFYAKEDLPFSKIAMPYLDIYMIGSYMELIGLLLSMFGGMIYTAGRISSR